VCKECRFNSGEPRVCSSHQRPSFSELPSPNQKSSPNRAEPRTFRLTFSLQHLKAPKRVKSKRPTTYRNPIALAKEWQAALESGECVSEADLACRLCVSRARVSQVLRLLRLSSEALDRIAALGDPLAEPILTERKLRPVVGLLPGQQKRCIEHALADSNSSEAKKMMLVE